MRKLKSIIKLLRIKQWIKNTFIFAAILFSGKFTNIELLEKNILVFFLFSFVASSIYILNDIVDIDVDKKNPKKKLRPLASGELSVSTAILTFSVLVFVSMGIAFFMNGKLFLIMLGYVLMNVLYSIKLKNIIIIDVMTIAVGFVIRIFLGAVVTNVSLSPWIIVCTGLVSLYLGFGKRKNELILLGKEAKSHREILSMYTLEYLDRIMLLTMGLTLITYLLYTINGTQYKNMIITFPFVVYGTFRYEYLILNKQMGDSPENVFTDDIPFLVSVFLWGISCVIVLRFLQ